MGECMNDDFKKLGIAIKEKREEKKLTLQEVESCTSIRMSILEAIESGEEINTVSSVYVNGFIRSYATYLGLDNESFVGKFPFIFQKDQQAFDFQYGIGTLERRQGGNHGVKWLPNLMWALVCAGGLLATYSIFKFFQII